MNPVGRGAYKDGFNVRTDHFVRNHRPNRTEYLRFNKDGAVILDRTEEAERVADAISKKSRHQVQTAEEVKAEAKRTLQQKRMPIRVQTVSVF